MQVVARGSAANLSAPTGRPHRSHEDHALLELRHEDAPGSASTSRHECCGS